MKDTKRKICPFCGSNSKGNVCPKGGATRKIIIDGGVKYVSWRIKE